MSLCTTFLGHSVRRVANYFHSQDHTGDILRPNGQKHLQTRQEC